MNFLWTFAGNLVYGACQWGLIVALAKLGTPEHVGQFALGLAVVTPVITFTNLHLREVQATDVRGEHPFEVYLGLRVITLGAALVAVTAITWLAGYGREMALVILLTGLARALDAVADVGYGLFQQRERMDLVAKSMVLRGLLSLAALLAGFVATREVAGAVAGLAIASAGALVAFDSRTARRLLAGGAQAGTSDWRTALGGAPLRSLRRNVERLARLAWTTLPLGVVMALIALNVQLPRYFVERLMGDGALGVYAALAYGMMAGVTVVSALAQSASARLSRHYALGERGAFCRLLGRLVTLGGLLGVGGLIVAWLGGRGLLSMVYRREYAEHADTFVWLMAAGAVWNVASCLGHGVMATRRFRALVPLYAAASGTTVLACAALIPAAGLNGAALAVAMSLTVQAAGSLGLLARALAALPVPRATVPIAARSRGEVS